MNGSLGGGTDTRTFPWIFMKRSYRRGYLFHVPPGTGKLSGSWYQCFEYLGRCHWTIEVGNLQDRKVWCAQARLWYRKAAHRRPIVGRHYHHSTMLVLKHDSTSNHSVCATESLNKLYQNIMIWKIAN
jgi:hypothetical protein